MVLFLITALALWWLGHKYRSQVRLLYILIGHIKFQYVSQMGYIQGTAGKAKLKYPKFCHPSTNVFIWKSLPLLPKYFALLMTKKKHSLVCVFNYMLKNSFWISYVNGIKKNNNNCSNTYEHGCGEKGTLFHCLWECKLTQPLWKSVLKNCK